jgi:hypothetical protein
MTEQMAICSEGHIRAALMLDHLADARSYQVINALPRALTMRRELIAR